MTMNTTAKRPSELYRDLVGGALDAFVAKTGIDLSINNKRDNKIAVINFLKTLVCFDDIPGSDQFSDHHRDMWNYPDCVLHK